MIKVFFKNEIKTRTNTIRGSTSHDKNRMNEFVRFALAENSIYLLSITRRKDEKAPNLTSSINELLIQSSSNVLSSILLLCLLSLSLISSKDHSQNIFSSWSPRRLTTWISKRRESTKSEKDLIMLFARRSRWNGSKFTETQRSSDASHDEREKKGRKT